MLKAYFQTFTYSKILRAQSIIFSDHDDVLKICSKIFKVSAEKKFIVGVHYFSS